MEVIRWDCIFRLARKNVLKMTHFVSSGTYKNTNSESDGTGGGQTEPDYKVVRWNAIIKGDSVVKGEWVMGD